MTFSPRHRVAPPFFSVSRFLSRLRHRDCYGRRCSVSSVLVVLILVNLFVLWWLLDARRRFGDEEDEDGQSAPAVRPQAPRPTSHVPEVTVVVREFEDFDNAVSAAVASVTHILPGVSVVVVADRRPYPPITLPVHSPFVKLVTLSPPRLPDAGYLANHLENVIKTPYVLILPDGAMVTKRDHVLKLLPDTLRRRRSVDAIAVGLSNRQSQLTCANVSFSPHRWTLTRTRTSDGGLEEEECRGGGVDEIGGEVAIFTRTALLWNFSLPLARPFPMSFFIQASSRNLVIRLESRFRLGVSRPLFADAHNRWKHKTLERERIKSFYKELGIKKVVYQHHPSSPSSVEWFGCTRETPRCFGTIVDGENPPYVEEGRWTPPCCLQKLRETTRRVVDVLEKAGVRYWLEGGSLLGAARHGDIIPWDYDVDLGIYQADIRLCRELRLAWDAGAHEDEEGFVWERAREADFFRVQFSRANRLHVDLFPFYPNKDGVMTKDFWFETHRQDTEFPERFLLPRTRIAFAGIQVSAPNSVKEFLELKFGRGVVENPRYPKGAPNAMMQKGGERPLLNGS